MQVDRVNRASGTPTLHAPDGRLLGSFTLTRTIDVSRPAREENLTLDEARDLLETWKLRGLGGG